MAFDPFGISALVSAGSKLIGQREERAYNERMTDKANRLSLQETRRQEKRQSNLIKDQRRYEGNVYERQRADALADYNLQRNRANVDLKRANEYNEAMRDESRVYQEGIDARNRSNQLEDIDQQFVRMRAAAEKAGLNPLAVLGGGGTMTPSALSSGSTSFAASAGPIQSTVQAPGYNMGSVPMSYGAPIAVTPLSSNEAVVGGVVELGQELTGSAAIERANEQFWQDMAMQEAQRDAAVPDAARSYPTVPDGRVPVMGNTATPVSSVSSTGNYSGVPVSQDPEIRTPLTMGVNNPDGSVTNIVAPGGDPEIDTVANWGFSDAARIIAGDFGVEITPSSAYDTWQQGVRQGAYGPVGAAVSVIREFTPSLSGTDMWGEAVDYVPGMFQGTRLQGGYNGQ